MATSVRHRDQGKQQAQEAQPAAAGSPSTAAATAGKSTLLVNEESTKKWRSAWVRTYTTFLMLGGFTLLFVLGHVPLMLLVVGLQVAMFREVKKLGRVLSSQQVLPSFRPLHWYWFFTAMFFSYGRVLAANFHVALPYHTFMSFALYILGVVAFVLSLETGYYKYQFEMFAWVHLTLLLIVVQSTVIVVNMFQGLIWFILPALLIICNDTWAYIFGFFFGRTPLIQLSPKKTWEGFIGAFFSTLLVGFFFSRVLSQFQLMICEKEDLNFEHPVCQVGLPYIPMPYAMPEFASSLLHTLTGGDWSYVGISPMQWHGVALALFASILAPFGGFFASGFKRAFNVKDFGDSIPGHGGFTDRMDCQIMMGLFVFVYYSTFVKSELDLHGNFLRFELWPDQLQVAYYEKIRAALILKGLVQP
jgi:phosphatidate cytidylyltransferase